VRERENGMMTQITKEKREKGKKERKAKREEARTPHLPSKAKVRTLPVMFFFSSSKASSRVEALLAERFSKSSETLSFIPAPSS